MCYSLKRQKADDKTVSDHEKLQTNFQFKLYCFEKSMTKRHTVGPDETADYRPSHLGLQYLQIQLCLCFFRLRVKFKFVKLLKEVNTLRLSGTIQELR